MNIAAIDIGSNTVLMLIASVENDRVTPLSNYYEMPRLGNGLGETGKIRPDKIKLLLDILKRYKSEADKYNCSEIIACATNAMRIASNSFDISELVLRETGIHIKIISGKEEARLSFLGGASAINFEGKVCVVDVGGGSTEIIYGDKGGIIYSKSFALGTVSLTERFFSSLPPAENEILSLRNFVNETFAELSEAIPAGIPAVAVAGTPTSLVCMNKKLPDYSEEVIEGAMLERDLFVSLIDEMKGLTASEMLEKYGSVLSGRNDVIFAGTLLLDVLLSIIKSQFEDKCGYIVSGKGLRFGIAADFALYVISRLEN